MPEPKILLSGLGIPESPRWHEGRLWFCNWIDRQVVAVDLDGKAQVMLVRDPASHSMGWSIDWLPDGRLLTTGAKLERQEPDGSMVTIAEQHANEIVVDASGNIYINGADFDFVAGAPPKPGYIKLVTPDGQLRQVADDIAVPQRHGHHPGRPDADHLRVVRGRLTAFDIDADGGLSGRRVFAEGLGPGRHLPGRRRRGLGRHGRVLGRPRRRGRQGPAARRTRAENRAPFALMLGGPDRRTLFICTAEWHTADGAPANLERLATGPAHRRDPRPPGRGARHRPAVTANRGRRYRVLRRRRPRQLHVTHPADHLRQALDRIRRRSGAH